jgi:DNA-binding LacI/PurR family transcriptional regulator
MSTATGIRLKQSPRQKVVSYLSQAISSGRLGPGSSIPAERRIAEKLMVSREAVRAALEDMCATGIIGQPAQRRMRRVLRSPAQTPAIAPRLMSNTVVLLGIGRVDDPSRHPGADAPIHFEIALQLENSGRHVMAVNPAMLTEDGPSSLAALRAAGILVTYAGGESPIGREVMDACAAVGMPVVAFGDGPCLQAYDRVESDHRHGACELVRLLAQRGRRRILRVWRLQGEHHWLAQRDAGYEQGVNELGLASLSPLRIPAIKSAGNTLRESHDYVNRVIAGYLGEHVLRPDGPDAIMCDTDGHAMQAIAALQLLGKRPNIDIDVVGYDNYWASTPEAQWVQLAPLATVDKRPAQLAQAMTELLQARLQNPGHESPQLRLIQPELIRPDGVTFPAAAIQHAGSGLSQSSRYEGTP